MQKFQVQGMPELLKMLATLEPKLSRKVLRKAIRKAAQPIRDAARAKAPVKTGKLRKSIRLRAAKRLMRGSVGIVVEAGGKDFTGDTFYGSFIEYGFLQNPVVRLDDGRIISVTRRMARRMERKQIPARPFMRPALDENRSRFFSIVRDEVERGIEQIAKAK
jgi:HK97 gp10 family phage protein